VSGRGTTRSALRHPEFRALWLAEAQSLLGDQFARVALVVLAYRQTGSPAITGAIYALTFLPAIVGGAMLSGLADRLPRRGLMIWCDVIRAGLLVTMAIPGLPLAVVGCLLVVAVLVGRPFAAAQLALLPEVLPGDAYVVGSGVRMVTDQIGQLVGFAAGGVIVAALGPHPTLLIDAATFLLSASILRGFVGYRPAAATRSDLTSTARRSAPSWRTGLTVAFGDPRRRALLGLGCLAGFHVVPEGIAPAYAASLGAGTAAVGVLMAALPLGTALGTGPLVRLPADRRSKLLGPLALATAVPLIGCALHPGVAVATTLWALSGLFAAYQVVASASFIASVPNPQRGQAIGIASSAIIASQGIGLIGFGAIADHVSPADAVAVAGAVAFVLAVPLAVSWMRASRAPDSAATPLQNPSEQLEVDDED
jgi:MFS family permease